jgi:hypothetical protein
MALIRGTNIAEEYWTTTLANLYPDSTLVPGVTFNPKTIYKAGGTYIPRLTKSNVNSPKLPGQDYDFTDVKDSLIAIVTNNSQTPARRLYEAQIETVSYDIINPVVEDLIKGDLVPAMNIEGISCLINEGTDIQDTTVITKDNIRDYLITLRKKMRDKGAKGTTLIVNTEVYAAILSVAGKDFDTDVRNSLNLTANIGTWLGWTIIESNIFSFYTEGKYIDYSGTEKTVDLSAIDLIAYDWNVFFIETLMNYLDTQKGTGFHGVEVVSEVINGYRVGDAEQVFVKKNK